MKYLVNIGPVYTPWDNWSRAEPLKRKGSKICIVHECITVGMSMPRLLLVYVQR